MIEISPTIIIKDSEIEFSFIRSPGPGGQNVNKVSTAVELRFNVLNSVSISDEVRIRLIPLVKLTKQGELIIKANSYRTQERNKADAIERLRKYILEAAIPIKKRKKTKPTFASKQKRLQNKKKLSAKKALRKNKSE